MRITRGMLGFCGIISLAGNGLDPFLCASSIPGGVNEGDPGPLSSGERIHWIEAQVVRRGAIMVGGRLWPSFLIETDVGKAGGRFKENEKPACF